MKKNNEMTKSIEKNESDPQDASENRCLCKEGKTCICRKNQCDCGSKCTCKGCCC